MKRSHLDAVLDRNKWSQIKDLALAGVLVIGFTWVTLFTQGQLSEVISHFDTPADPIAETVPASPMSPQAI